MIAGVRVSLAGALVFGLIFGCKASVNADASVSGEGAKGKAEADFDASGKAEGQGEMTRSALVPGGTLAAASQPGAAGQVLLGARHDLKLRSGSATTTCECLSVALGGARSSGMAWSATPPDIDDATQLSIALSSEGQTCKGEPKNSLGASYWGYRIRGNDVVVMVEAARGGRPLTNGAVIPKPVGAGQVYVSPVSKKLPYGRPPDGKGLCKIGNPGERRSTPFSDLEMGENEPARGANERAVSDHSSDDMPTTIEMPSN